MSTPVDNSLTNLKASTGQIMAIISGTQKIPLSPSHSALGKQVATLVADVVKEYGSSRLLRALVHLPISRFGTSPISRFGVFAYFALWCVAYFALWHVHLLRTLVRFLALMRTPPFMCISMHSLDLGAFRRLSSHFGMFYRALALSSPSSAPSKDPSPVLCIPVLILQSPLRAFSTHTPFLAFTGDGPLPSLIISCSKELLHVQNMVPKVWSDWHSIGYDNPRILRHAWYPKSLTWKALGDPTFGLPTAAPPSTSPIPVNLPSPAIPAGNVAGPSTNPTTESWDKGKGKAVFPDPEPKAEGSKKRKSPLISGLSSQPPKSAMKSHKHQRSARLVKSKPIVESEDDEDSVIQPLSHGVLEVVLPQLSIIVARTPNSPHSPRAPTKKPFGPARVIAGSHPAVMEPSQPTPKPPVHTPPVMPVVDILIPRLNNPCYTCHKLSWPCATWLDKRTRAPCMSCIYCTTKKIKCTPVNMGSLPPCIRATSTTRKTRLMTPSTAPSKTPSKAPPASQTPGPSTAPPASQSMARTSYGTAVTTPQTQTRGRSKTITAIKPPAPPPAPALKSPESAVPAAAPGPAVPAAALEARVAEQDGIKSSTSTPHSHFPTLLPMQHPCCLINPVPRTMSPPESALPPLIDLSMETLAPTTVTPTFPDASAIEGLLFDYDQVVHPEDQDASSDIVDPGDPSNLVSEYDSSNNMDVEMEVKVDESSEEVDMAT
ncbi:hypothetical protein BDR03DRAFT_1012709 [Suillus americanus]|nr:hypothetical protein BDR03DRAFT_1012709 [Suillus americanus]